MRRPFVQELVALAESDPRIVLLTGDLGYTVLEPFQERFPDRFINAGVAEQNMMGMATGLAEAGMRPFVYSIAPFAVLRPYEFFRNGAVLQGLPVCVVGVGGGVDYSHEGGTHFALEDVAVLRPLEQVRIFVPADVSDAVLATRLVMSSSAPAYLRLGKDEQWCMPGAPSGELTSPRMLVRGADTLLICLGPMVRTGLAAAEELGSRGVSAGVAVVTSFNAGLEAGSLADLVRPFADVATIEAHFQSGALGSAIAEAIAEHGLSTRLTRFGFTTELDGRSGSAVWWMREAGMAPDQIADRLALRLEDGRSSGL